MGNYIRMSKWENYKCQLETLWHNITVWIALPNSLAHIHDVISMTARLDSIVRPLHQYSESMCHDWHDWQPWAGSIATGCDGLALRACRSGCDWVRRREMRDAWPSPAGSKELMWTMVEQSHEKMTDSDCDPSYQSHYTPVILLCTCTFSLYLSTYSTSLLDKYLI